MKNVPTVGCISAAIFCPVFTSIVWTVTPTTAEPDWTTPPPQLQQEPPSGLKVAQTAAVPIIASLSPSSGPLGTPVTIRGANFTSENRIQFSSEQAQKSFLAGSPVASESGTSLRFYVSTCPSFRPLCPGFYVPPGVYTVTVINSHGASNEGTFALTSP
jgi:IPT/TIG domain